MAAIDKICACCGRWQDLLLTGAKWDKEIKTIVPTYKRFHILNVCKPCTESLKKTTFCLIGAKVLKVTTERHKQHWGKFWFPKRIGSGYELRFDRYEITPSKPYTWLWEIDLPFFDGLIRSRDKRKLRRGLRKIGCRGKIERVIL